MIENNSPTANNRTQENDWSRYSITIHVIAFCGLVLGACALVANFLLANRDIALRIALMFSPDAHVTQGLLQSLGVAQTRLRFIGVLSLFCGVLLLFWWYFLRAYMTKVSVFLSRIWSVVNINNIRWGRVFGFVGAVYLLVTLTVSVLSTPISIDASLRFAGAKEYVATGSLLPLDAAGDRIIDRWDEPFVRYVPAVLCIFAGGDVQCTRILYAIFCMFCIFILGYFAQKMFQRQSGGYAIFFAAMLPLPFYHLIATDSARTEFIASLFLLAGIFALYKRSQRSWLMTILACLMIGIATWLKFTLLILTPVFIITGLLSGMNREFRGRILAMTLGPIVGIAVVWVVDTVLKIVLFGDARAVLGHIFSYWFISDVHMTLASTVAMPITAKILAIDRLFPWPIFAGVMIVFLITLIKDRFRYPLKVFTFLAICLWFTWWIFFDNMGMSRHLIVGVLFFCVMMGGCYSYLLCCLSNNWCGKVPNEIQRMVATAKISITAISVIFLMVFSIRGVLTDLAWLDWAIPMREGQEQLARYVMQNRDRTLFCSWGTTGAYDISVLSGEPFWDISRGMPPYYVHGDRSVQLLVTSWQKHGFELEYEQRQDGGLYPAQREFITSRGRLLARLGSNDIYEVDD